jgi:drug/metabolite transporter (DMT)-like permease
MNRAYVALLLAALSWGLALTTADAALAEISATDLLLLETAAGTGVVLVACLLTGRRIGGAWRPAVVLGSLEPGIAYVFANVGLIMTSAAVGSMLFALESVFVVGIAAVLLRTRPRRVEVSALLLGVLGTVMVASAQSGGRSSGMGVGIMVVSTLISAGYVLATKRFAGGNEPVALVARQGVASLIVTSPFILGASLNGGSELATASIGCILLACLTGVIGFAVPYTLWTTSLPYVRPGFAAVALNLVPLMGVISATVLGQGGLSSGQWAGGGLILVGLVLLTRAEMAMPAETTEPSVEPLTIPAPRQPVGEEAPATNPIPVTPIVPDVPIIPIVPNAPVGRVVSVSVVPVLTVVPGPRKPVESVATADLPEPVPFDSPLPERIREVADAGMRRLRENQESDRHRLRPRQATTGISAGEPGVWSPVPAQGSKASPGLPGHREQDQAHESLVGWLRGQQDVDTDVDVEVIALILNNAISHYQVMTDVLEQDPFGIEEDRYLTAVADLAAACLTR